MSHLTNPLATAAQLARCRDRAMALPLPGELLDVVFFAVQRLTQAAGLLLELPQSTTARANVLLARFWVQEPGFGVVAGSPVDYRHVSAAVVYLVAKTGPIPRSARDVANVYHYLATAAASTAASTPAETKAGSDSDYVNFHTHVLACERRLLAALAFETHVTLPHPLAITYLQALSFLGTAPQGALSRRTVEHLNTALLSPQLLYVTHQPHELAVAALYSAARELGLRLPDAAGAWWEVFDVDRETLGFLAVALRSVTSAMTTAAGTSLLPASLGGLTKQWVAEAAEAAEAAR